MMDTIAVLNKGFDTVAGKWKEAHGKSTIQRTGHRSFRG